MTLPVPSYPSRDFYLNTRLAGCHGMHHHRRVDANRVTTEQSSNTLASLRGTAPDKNREERTMRLPQNLIAGLGTLLIAALCAGTVAQAQAPAAGSNLSWGLPPL